MYVSSIQGNNLNQPLIFYLDAFLILQEKSLDVIVRKRIAREQSEISSIAFQTENYTLDKILSATKIY